MSYEKKMASRKNLRRSKRGSRRRGKGKSYTKSRQITRYRGGLEEFPILQRVCVQSKSKLTSIISDAVNVLQEHREHHGAEGFPEWVFPEDGKEHLFVEGILGLHTNSLLGIQDSIRSWFESEGIV